MPTPMICTRSALVGALLALGMPSAWPQTPPRPTGPPLAAPGSAPAPAAPSTTEPEVASYEVGLMLGRQLYQNGLAETVRWDALVGGLKAGIAGTVATDEQRAHANQFIKSSRDSIVERNRAAARAFLEKNAKAEGVKTTPSGLQYRVMADGDAHGSSPRASDQVTVRYRAALSDGVEFDSSEAHGQAATVRMATIIKGWQEALLMMKPGAKWQLFVPPELGYGATPPPAIPPGALLIYELELVRVEAPAQVDPNLSHRPAPKGAGEAPPPGDRPSPK
jgi:FKBP-type peptidyl-prolyl cis-trans isomerase FklB